MTTWRRIMTSTQMNEIHRDIIDDNSFVERNNLKERRRHIKNNVKKNERLFRIINFSGYSPQIGYIDWDFTGSALLHTGEYIHYPKNSNCQRWIKRETSRRVRRCKDLPKKSNYHHKLFDYWGILY